MDYGLSQYEFPGGIREINCSIELKKAWQRRLAQCSGWIDGRNSTSLSNFTNKSKKKDEKMTKYQRKKGNSSNLCRILRDSSESSKSHFRI